MSKYTGLYNEIICIFQNYEKRVWWLRVNESKIITENAFNYGYFGNKGSFQSDNDKRNCLSNL